MLMATSRSSTLEDGSIDLGLIRCQPCRTFGEASYTRQKHIITKKNEKILNLHWARGGGFVRLSAKSCHVNPVEILRILRFLPLGMLGDLISS